MFSLHGCHGNYGFQKKGTCFPYMSAMATMALMEAVAAIFNLRIFGMKKIYEMTMNYSKDGFRVSHHEQKYLCSFCNFRTHKKYNLDMHTKNKHGTSQTGSGALLEEQTDPHHVQQESLNQHFVPIETYNNVFRQWQGWSSAYQDLEARNKQLEADQNLNRNHANERLNRQWAVAYKQLELRNKILEEEKAQLKAWKNKNKIYVKKHPYL